MQRKSVKPGDMCDAVGHPVVAGDYVTATWANADVCLFKVSSVVPSRYENIVVLERLNNNVAGDERAGKSAFKPVRRTTNQITWVDPNWICFSLLAK